MESDEINLWVLRELVDEVAKILSTIFEKGGRAGGEMVFYRHILLLIVLL